MPILLLFLLFGWTSTLHSQTWPHTSTSTLRDRIPPPSGFVRIPLPSDSFGVWLRGLPLKPEGSMVHLFDGRPKKNPLAHHSVVDLDVDPVDLQQCADAVMRLRAEFLWEKGRKDEIKFFSVGGQPLAWPEWRSSHEGSYRSFRKYLKWVFGSANTVSLSKQMRAVSRPKSIEPGDVFVKGGYPGHAVLVLDVAEDPKGDRVFLLGQSYMPAQEFHVLKTPLSLRSPWYEADGKGKLVTPEWVFDWAHLRRFEKP